MKTYFISTLILFSVLVGCTKNKKSDKTPENLNKDSTTENRIPSVQDANFKIIELSKPTIVSHMIDSIGFDQLLEKYGEDAETAFDDLMWYNYKMNEMADSLGIPVQEYKARKIAIKYGKKTFQHLQDTASGAETHFYFDGKTLKQYDLLELTDIIQKVGSGQ